MILASQNFFKPKLSFILGLWFLALVLINLGQALSQFFPLLAQVPFVFLVQLYLPLLFWPKNQLKHWLLPKKADFFWLLGLSLVVLPLAGLINHFLELWFFKRSFLGFSIQFFDFTLLSTVFFLAFAEEFFFRGFLQSLFETFFKQRAKKEVPKTQKITFWQKLELNRAQFLTAFLFSISHSLVYPFFLHWWHPLIFFPAFLFGFLRNKTQSLWAATLFHAFCNLFAYWVSSSYQIS